MGSLGYNVPLHRTLAFGFAAFIASLGGVLFVWWNGLIAPPSIDLSATIDVLVIAVLGGLFRHRGRLGGRLRVRPHQQLLAGSSFVRPRFHTLVGLIFLVIVLVSPSGLMGLWERFSPASTSGRGGGWPSEALVEIPAEQRA